MMLTELTFRFENTFEAQSFIEKINGASIGYKVENITLETGNPMADPMELREPNPLPMPPKPDPKPPRLETVDAIEVLDETGADVLPDLPDTKPMSKPVEPMTARKLSGRLRAYKNRHGHVKYREVLDYFGVNAVRDIPKSEYDAVLSMIEGNQVTSQTVSEDKPIPYIPTAPIEPEETPPAKVEVQPQEIEETLQETPQALAELLRGALSEHKARWGIEATRAALHDLGYPEPNDIPEEKYSWVTDQIKAHEPKQNDDYGIDLSAF